MVAETQHLQHLRLFFSRVLSTSMLRNRYTNATTRQAEWTVVAQERICTNRTTEEQMPMCFLLQSRKLDLATTLLA
eukprot:SAG31_NODE_670_length_12943_cov_18.029508_6_plen_76_part_00